MKLTFQGNHDSDLKHAYVELNEREIKQGVDVAAICLAMTKTLKDEINVSDVCECAAGDNTYGHIVYDSFFIEKHDIKQALKLAKK